LLQTLAQIGAEATQLFDAGDDAVLFGEGGPKVKPKSFDLVCALPTRQHEASEASRISCQFRPGAPVG
jgi:hypothetical protein